MGLKGRAVKLLLVLVCLFCFFASLSCLAAPVADSHLWSRWITDSQPTCTEAGHRYRICTSDPGYRHTEEESIPARGHQYIIEETPPSCLSRGTRTTTCDICGYSFSELFGEVTPHSYEMSVVSEPGCGTEGSQAYICTVCGDTYMQTLPPLEHIYKESITREPNCSHIGLKTFTCSLCGDSYELPFGEIAKHRFNAGVADEHGAVQYTCLVCDFSYKTDKKPQASGLLPVNITLGALNIAALLIFGMALAPDVQSLSWHRKRKRALKLLAGGKWTNMGGPV